VSTAQGAAGLGARVAAGKVARVAAGQVAPVAGAQEDDLKLEERGSGTWRRGTADEFRPAADP
jgi:hypothetical protein